MAEIGKLLLIIGAMLLVVGFVFVLLGRTNLPIGRLPGDIIIPRQEHNVLLPAGHVHSPQPCAFRAAVCDWQIETLALSNQTLASLCAVTGNRQLASVNCLRCQFPTNSVSASSHSSAAYGRFAI